MLAAYSLLALVAGAVAGGVPVAAQSAAQPAI